MSETPDSGPACFILGLSVSQVRDVHSLLMQNKSFDHVYSFHTYTFFSRVFGAALLSDEKATGTCTKMSSKTSARAYQVHIVIILLVFSFAVAVTKAVSAPCWQLEEFVVAKECSACEGFHSVSFWDMYTHAQIKNFMVSKIYLMLLKQLTKALIDQKYSKNSNTEILLKLNASLLDKSIISVYACMYVLIDCEL